MRLLRVRAVRISMLVAACLLVVVLLVWGANFSVADYRELEPGDSLPTVVEAIGWPKDVQGYEWLFIRGDTAYIVRLEEDLITRRPEIAEGGLSDFNCSPDCWNFFDDD